jgi:hypothetical protein
MMKMLKPELIKELTAQYTLLPVDFYDNGEDKETFIFRAEQVTPEKAENLWEEYNTLYQNDQYDGAFEDFLNEKPYDFYTLSGGEC